MREAWEQIYVQASISNFKQQITKVIQEKPIFSNYDFLIIKENLAKETKGEWPNWKTFKNEVLFYTYLWEK